MSLPIVGDITKSAPPARDASWEILLGRRRSQHPLISVGCNHRWRKTMRLILNIIWLIFGGLWLALGYLLAALICFVLIITIPFGFAALRIALVRAVAVRPHDRRQARARARARWSATSSG